MADRETFQAGFSRAAGCGVVIAVAVVVCLQLELEKLAELVFFVPVAVLLLVGSAHLQDRRRYGAGLLVGTVVGVLLTLVAVVAWVLSVIGN